MNKGFVILELKTSSGTQSQSFDRLKEHFLSKFDISLTEESMFRLVFEIDVSKHSLSKILQECVLIKDEYTVHGFNFSAKSATLEHLFFKYIKSE